MNSFLKVEITSPSFFQPKDFAWVEHGPFAMWLIEKLQPRRVVELGTHWGYSYFAMCEAVQKASLDTQCFAVGTWVGDMCEGANSGDAFNDILKENEKYSAFSTILSKPFDSAISDIADGTVDLLHISGKNLYEDIKDCYELWRNKLTDQAVVLIHNIADLEGSPGVHRYWKEISSICPSFNFLHGGGLGVLMPGKSIPANLVDAKNLSREDGGEGVIEDFFSIAGRRCADNFGAQLEICELRGAIESEGKRSILGNSDFRRILSRIEYLEEKLIYDRAHPVRTLNDYIKFKALTAISRVVAPVSLSRAKKLSRSADKRAPDFHVKNDSSLDIRCFDYEFILNAWENQRKDEISIREEIANDLQDGPVISIVVPVCDAKLSCIRKMVESVFSQSYSNWELCISSNCLADPRISDLINEYREGERRVKYAVVEGGRDISGVTNAALDLTSGRYIAIIDGDALLDPDALLWVAKSIKNNPEASLVYSDEDKTRNDGSRFDPHFKADWNRELLYANNYISNLCIYDAKIARTLGGMRVEFEGAQNYDFLLRFIERIHDSKIVHIPKVLYSRRAGSGGTAPSGSAKLSAWEYGRKALAEHLLRVEGREIPVELGAFPLSYRAMWPIDDSPIVSIIIPTRDQLNLLQKAVDSILEKTDYQNFEILVVDNGSQDPDTILWLSQIQIQEPRVRVLRDERPFNYSALNNAAVLEARGDLIALINNDVEVIEGGWLREMVSLATRPEVGCVGAKLLFPDGRIQHAGVIIGIGGVAGHSHLFFGGDQHGYFGRLSLRQEYSAVTAACLVVKRSIYEEVDGLNESDLAIAFNDVDFCLKVREAGYCNIWTPWAKLNHYESASRGREDTPEKKARFRREAKYMKSKWATDTFIDPAYNPNLTTKSSDFGFAKPRWTLSDEVRREMR